MRVNKKPSPVNAVAEVDPILVNADILSHPSVESSTTIAPNVASLSTVPPVVSTISSNSSKELPVRSSTMPIQSDNSDNVPFKLNATTIHTPNYSDDDDESTDSSQSNEAYAIPLKIILPVPHVHALAPENRTFQRFNYILLKVNDSAFHEHFAYDKPMHLFPVSESTNNSSTITNTTTPTYGDSSSERDNFTRTTPFGSDNEIYRNYHNTRSNSDAAVLLTDSEGYRYQRGKLHQILNENGDIVNEFEDIHYARIEGSDMTSNRDDSSARELQLDRTTEEPVAANDDAYDQHYGKMLQWIHYHL